MEEEEHERCRKDGRNKIELVQHLTAVEQREERGSTRG